MTPEPALAFRDVTARRGGRTIWSQGTFIVPHGSTVAVIGPNGAGKSTLLRMILGLIEPAAGSIAVLGDVPHRGDSRIGYVPQHPAALGEMVRCRDLVAIGVTGARWGIRRLRPSQHDEIDAIIHSVAASAFAYQRLARLSGGQQQRIAIAQALVGHPRLLLLDEPLASLDLRNQHEIVTLLGQLRTELDLTTMIVTHDLNPLLPIATSAIYLLDGHAHYDDIDNVVDVDLLTHLYGTPMRVVRTPQGDLFTRGA